MSGEEGLGSAGVPAVGDEDWVRGPDDARLVLIEYADFECPFCATLELRLSVLDGPAAPRGVRRVFRHFPVRSAHPRALAAACAAEAAGRQGRFWEMYSLLFSAPAQLEDPHLWERAERLGLDVDRFDADRRSEEVAARVRRDFTSGVRAGVVTTPTVFVDGHGFHGDELRALVDALLRG